MLTEAISVLHQSIHCVIPTNHNTTIWPLTYQANSGKLFCKNFYFFVNFPPPPSRVLMTVMNFSPCFTTVSKMSWFELLVAQSINLKYFVFEFWILLRFESTLTKAWFWWNVFHEPQHLLPTGEIFVEDEIHLWQWKSSSTNSALSLSIFQHPAHIYHICLGCIVHKHTISRNFHFRTLVCIIFLSFLKE